MHIAFISRGGAKKRIRQIVIPHKYKAHVLAANHLSHFGHNKTYYAIREKYFWENLYSDTKNYVESCKFCIEYKSPNRIPPVPLQRHFIPTKPMEYVSCDFIGKLPTTNKGNNYILTFIDHFTKFVKLYAVNNQSAETTAEKFLDFACTFGFPQYLLTDRGTNFTSDLFQRLTLRLGVTKLQTTAMNPRSNGQSEQINSNIKKSLSIFARETAQWDEHIDFYSLLYNSSFHTTVQDKPAFLHFSYDPVLPTDILNEPTKVQQESYPDYISNKTRKMKYTFEKVHQHLLQSAENQEEYQGRNAKYREFYVGQIVYLHSPDADRNAHLPKRRKFIGPYRILKIHNKVNFTIININNRLAKPYKVHAHRLIPITERREYLNYLQNSMENDSPNLIQRLDPVRPPPRFDDFTEEQLIQIASENQNINVHNFHTSSPFDRTLNSNNNETERSLPQLSGQPQIIQFPPDLSTPPPVLPIPQTSPVLQASQRMPEANTIEIPPRYPLRSRGISVTPQTANEQNIAVRLLDWALDITKD
jgi:hypothetical protein